MAAKFHPIVSEFSTQEDADSYDLWFRSKVEASLRRADEPSTTRYTSDEVKRRMDVVIQAARVKHAQHP